MKTAKAIIVGDNKFKAVVSLELAVSAADKARGLSGRSEVPAATGMLFDGVGAYWMRGCKVPLDIAFAKKDGTILEIQTMSVPTSESDLPLYRPKFGKPDIAVEFKAGWLRSLNIKPGHRIVVLEV